MGMKGEEDKEAREGNRDKIQGEEEKDKEEKGKGFTGGKEKRQEGGREIEDCKGVKGLVLGKEITNENNSSRLIGRCRAVCGG